MEITVNDAWGRLLVIDDDADFLNFIKTGLKKRGYSVITAISGDSGLELLKAEPVGLVLLDEQMPGMSGMETFDYIKRDAGNIPVIMLTAQDSLDLAVAFMQKGGADFIQKPVKIEVLEARIIKTFKAPELKDRLAVLERDRAVLAELLKTIGGFSHDINNPLNSIFTAVDLLDRAGSDSELVYKINKAMHRIHHVLLDLDNAVALRQERHVESAVSAIGKTAIDH